MKLDRAGAPIYFLLSPPSPPLLIPEARTVGRWTLGMLRWPTSALAPYVIYLIRRLARQDDFRLHL